MTRRRKVAKKNSVWNFFKSPIGKVITIVLGIYIVISIVPGLLNAENDFAVTMGMIIIVAIIVAVVKYWDFITDWLKS